MRAELKAREETSYSEDVGLNAEFFVFTLEDFDYFLDRTPAEELGWSCEKARGIDMVPTQLPITNLENDFKFILNHGLWELREDAERFTFEQSASWDAQTAFYGFVFDDDDHECTEGDGCISVEELLKRI